MIKKRKICVITGSRADYDLLFNLIKDIDNHSKLALQLIVTGMHLSPKFGNTYKQIISDKIKIDKKINLRISTDSELSISKSIGIAIIGFAHAFTKLKPDILVLLGDRYEVFAAASAAMIAKIPIAHIHGGEKTKAAFDDYIRHAITKMSHLHFTASSQYRKRVIQLGEQPKRVFNVGALFLDNIKKGKYFSRTVIEQKLSFKLNKYNLLITFHPETLNKNSTQNQFKNILQSLDKLSNTHFIFTKSNSDTGGKIINRMIDSYVNKNITKAKVFSSLGRSMYIPTLRHMNGVVGNSSSGIIEAPSCKIGTINIGDRQKGRIQTKSIINCDFSTQKIDIALKKLFSKSFKEKLKNIEIPYKDFGTSKKIIKIIKSYPLNDILMKNFYDI